MLVKRYETVAIWLLIPLLFYLSFSKFGLWFLIFPALFLLSSVRGFKGWFAVGFLSLLPSLLWIRIAMIDYGGVSPPIAYALISLLALSLSLYQFGLTYALWKLFRHNLIALPFCWVFAEILRSSFPYGGFPWLLVGENLVDFPLMKLYLSAGGVYLGSLLVWFLSLAPRLLREPKTAAVLVLIFLLPVPFADTAPKAVPPIRIAVIQPAVPEEVKLSKDRFYAYLPHYWELMDKAVAHKPDIILLPESAFPFSANYLHSEGRKLLAYSEKAVIVTGLIDIRYGADGPEPYNSVFVLHRGRVVDFYDKVRLLPFGEFVPFPFGFAKEIFGAIGGVDYVPGSGVRCIKAGSLKLATPICFEISYFHLVKEMVSCADLVAVLTNDAWFRDSDGTYQHMRHARVRAVENRTHIVWVNNTGPSALISPSGKVLREIPYGERGFFIYSFQE
jgi:apolipoprotein N-acyltransferase